MRRASVLAWAKIKVVVVDWARRLSSVNPLPLQSQKHGIKNFGGFTFTFHSIEKKPTPAFRFR